MSVLSKNVCILYVHFQMSNVFMKFLEILISAEEYNAEGKVSPPCGLPPPNLLLTSDFFRITNLIFFDTLFRFYQFFNFKDGLLMPLHTPMFS